MSTAIASKANVPVVSDRGRPVITAGDASAGGSLMPRDLVWTAAAYNAAAESGAFEGRQVQLIYGRIIEMAPMGDDHRTSIDKATRVLVRLYDDGSRYVSPQTPRRLGHSEPEPDFTIRQGQPGATPESPDDVLLVIELSDSSLVFDRTTKVRLYAESGYAEYWIVDIPNRRLLVHRGPITPAGDEGRYESVSSYVEDQQAAPAFAPDKPVKVADLLP